MKVKGKFSSYPRFFVSRLHRDWRRRGLGDIVSWDTVKERELAPGCTALVGMSHRMPHVLLANLACLAENAADTLQEAIVVVDSVEGCLPPDLEARAQEVSRNLPVRFFYYSEHQSQRADRIALPYLYSWLSWSIAISHCRTKTILLHDYDALILDDALDRRYRNFLKSNTLVQGIRWYNGSGLVPEDRLATTFEAFIDLEWLRAYPPIRLFNRIAWKDGRTVDYDTLLDLQANEAAVSQRAIEPMSSDSLMHPSQMVHQYTMARRTPGAAMPVGSLPMVPFFEWLGGRVDALDDATARVVGASGRSVKFFEDLEVNFSLLGVPQVDWCLKQMLQACLSLGRDPGPSLYKYGKALYRLVDSRPEEVWRGDFTPAQRAWIDREARSLAV